MCVFIIFKNILCVNSVYVVYLKNGVCKKICSLIYNIISYLWIFLDEMFNCDNVQRIVKTVESNDVVVISGETGCGKTTQVRGLFCELNCRVTFIRLLIFSM